MESVWQVCVSVRESGEKGSTTTIISNFKRTTAEDNKNDPTLNKRTPLAYCNKTHNTHNNVTHPRPPPPPPTRPHPPPPPPPKVPDDSRLHPGHKINLRGGWGGGCRRRPRRCPACSILV